MEPRPGIAGGRNLSRMSNPDNDELTHLDAAREVEKELRDRDIDEDIDRTQRLAEKLSEAKRGAPKA